MLIQIMIFNILACSIIFYISDPFEIIYGLFSIMGLFFVLLLFLLFLNTRNTRYLAGFFPIAMTWIYFLLPYLKSEMIMHDYRIIPQEHLYHMSIFSMFSIVAFFIGFVIHQEVYDKTIFKKDFFKINQLEKLFWTFLLLGILQRYLESYMHWIYRPLGEIMQVFEFSQVLALSIGLLYFLRGGKSAIVMIIYFLFFNFELFYRISDTLFSKVFYMLSSMLLVYIIEKKHIPWKIILLVFILSIPAFNNRKVYREEVFDRWFYGAESISVIQRVSKGFNFFYEPLLDFEIEELGNIIDSQSSSRFENISYLGQCVHMVMNQDKELKWGSTFLWFPLAIIPRAIFPWKPINNLHSEVAQEYGTKGFAKGAMNFPMLVEFFINFGFYGMIIFSFFQGYFTNWILSKTGYAAGDLNLLIFINLFWHLVKIESNVAMIFGGFLQVVLTW